MSTNFKCLYCDRYLSSRNAYSQHVKDCKERYTSTEESNDNISSIVSSINDMSFDSDDFSNIEELQSIREENQQPVSEISYQFESDSSYAGDISFGGISHLSNIPEELSNFEESLQNYTEKSDTNKIYSNMIPEEFENFDQILSKRGLHKTPTAFIYSSKLFDFKLSETSVFLEEQKKNLDLNENMIKAFDHFINCLDLFFDELDITSAED
ncbi:23323_t:CDS:2, partial [Dentiscutata erythropus]